MRQDVSQPPARIIVVPSAVPVPVPATVPVSVAVPVPVPATVPVPVPVVVPGMVDIGDRRGGGCRFGHRRYRRRHRYRGECGDHRDTCGCPAYRGRSGCREHTSIPSCRASVRAARTPDAPPRRGVVTPRRGNSVALWACRSVVEATSPGEHSVRGPLTRPTRSQFCSSRRPPAPMWPNRTENRSRVLGGNPDARDGRLGVVP